MNIEHPISYSRLFLISFLFQLRTSSIDIWNLVNLSPFDHFNLLVISNHIKWFLLH
jgi:hypothetical protein